MRLLSRKLPETVILADLPVSWHATGVSGLLKRLAPLVSLIASFLGQSSAAELQRQPDEGRWKIWHSAHFRIEMESPLPPAELVRLAKVAEATAQALKSHPLPLFDPPEGRCRIIVFSTDAEYAANGGIAGTAGYYEGRENPRVIIHGAHLARASHETNTRLPPQMNDDLIVHEIVHLCMHRVNSKLPQWLQEGLAEYFACAHRGEGRFEFKDMDVAIRDHLRIRFNPRDPTMVVARIGTISGLNWREWIDHLNAMPIDERYGAYATALLMTHYHLHGGPERIRTIKSLLTAPADRGRIHHPIPPADGPELESTLFRYWKSRGLAPVFSSPAADIDP